MKVGRIISNRIHFLFIAVQLFLFISFIILDLSGGRAELSNAIKFTIIFMCFCYVLPLQSHNRSISYSLKAAMLFTLISDLFILILDYYLYGVFTFIIVQLLYNYRISVHNASGHYSAAKGVFISRLIIQLLISGCICLLLAFLGVELVPLLIAAAVYFTGLVMNTVRALAATIKERGDISMRLFAAGLLLFLLCDINVGLFNLSSFIKLPQDIYSIIYRISSFLMWFFYAPSQTLIALSTNLTREKVIWCSPDRRSGKEKRNK